MNIMRYQYCWSILTTGPAISSAPAPLNVSTEPATEPPKGEMSGTIPVYPTPGALIVKYMQKPLKNQLYL